MLPEGAGLGGWEVLVQHVLDAPTPPPRAGVDGWVEREGGAVAGACAAYASLRAERDEVRLGQWLRTLTSAAPEPGLDWAFWGPGEHGPELVSAGRFTR